jgi:hypothetical protein
MLTHHRYNVELLYWHSDLRPCHFTGSGTRHLGQVHIERTSEIIAFLDDHGQS